MRPRLLGEPCSPPEAAAISVFKIPQMRAKAYRLSGG